MTVRKSRLNKNITDEQLSQSLFPASNEKDEQARDIFVKISNFVEVLHDLFKMSFKRISDVETRHDCPVCKGEKSISLWEQAAAYPRFYCKGCNVAHIVGNSFMDLIQLKTGRHRVAISSVILAHEEKKSASKKMKPAQKPKLPGVYAIQKGKK